MKSEFRSDYYFVTKLLLSISLFIGFVLTLFLQSPLQARNPIRRAFFTTYPVAVDTHLDNLTSNSNHCGVCHFNFDGGGQRNPYGLALEIGLKNGLSNEEAILAIDGLDSDADGFANNVEASDLLYFSNTPTFPGLLESNKNSALSVNIADIKPYLTPSGGTDTILPSVNVLNPDGGENLIAETYYSVNFNATDASGISYLNIYFSDDGGSIYKPVGSNEPPGTGFSWFVPNLPGTNNRIKVEAFDNSGNPGEDISFSDFTVTATPPGYVPSTLRDMEMPGTHPHEGAILDDPDISCATCHGNYDTDNEPWYNWRGSMMAQAMRDPLFLACMAIAEQDAPSVGDLCIRCHTPGGWQEGRSVDTSGDMVNAKDRHGVHCDFCHRVVDYYYQPGLSPVEDIVVLSNVNPIPLQYGNGQFINDPAPLRRGPYADAEASHAFVESPIHRSSNICGTCHDVSSPVFENVSLGDYVPNNFDTEHPDMDIRNMLPIERTFSEWQESEYALVGVYAPEFAGNKADGIVSTCQDCHMKDVSAKGANVNGVNARDDLALHDMMGGNTFIPNIIGEYFPDEVDEGQLQKAVLRARSMLQKAATMELIQEEFGITVKVTNQTAHKLPSGYPEGRRIWINVQALDVSGAIIYQSGEYDYTEARIIDDSQLKIYEIHHGISHGLAAAIGLSSGKSFHFVLNDTIYSDDRIPPRGFTNTGFESIQSHPVAYSYEDGQYWDLTSYNLPLSTDSVIVNLYYQTTTREYVEFLRDENTTNDAGQNMYASWVNNGKGEPELMVQARAEANVTITDAGDNVPALIFDMKQNYPNPFNPITRISYSLAKQAHVNISVFNVRGRKIRTLVNKTQQPSQYTVVWDGRNDVGADGASGIYFIRYKAEGFEFTRKAILLR